MELEVFTTHNDYLYVEPTTHCALKCPRCPRTFNPSSYKLEHLDLETYERILSSKYWSQLRTIEFGGNYGDPIFHPRLNQIIEISQKLQPQAKLILHTSGNRPPRWWSEIIEKLKVEDIVLLSIDGLSDSNHLYRINSRWDWVKSAIETAVNKTQVWWKFIIFKHNQEQIEHSIVLAKELGVQKFLLVKSHLFNGSWQNSEGVDPLAPDLEWIAHPLIDNRDTFSPKCQNRSHHYISASGHYSPCCWSNFQDNLQYQIDAEVQDPMQDIIQSPNLLKLKEKWKLEQKHFCHKKCSVPKHSRTVHQRLDINLTEPIHKILKDVSSFKNEI